MNLQSITVPIVLLFMGEKTEEMNVSVQGSVVKCLFIPYPVPLILFTQLASKCDDSQIFMIIQSCCLISSCYSINLTTC